MERRWWCKRSESLGLPALVREHVQIKERQRGYDEATLVESFVILKAVGGECLDDFVRLREDAGLSEMVGHQVPSPSVARKFLYEFHEEASWRRPSSGVRRSRSPTYRKKPNRWWD